MTWINNLSISKKLTLGAIVSIALTISVASTGFLGASVMGTAIDRNVQMIDVLSDFNAVVQTKAKYLVSSDDGLEQQLTTHLASLKAKLRVLAQANGDTSRVETVDAFEDSLNQLFAANRVIDERSSELSAASTELLASGRVLVEESRAMEQSLQASMQDSQGELSKVQDMLERALELDALIVRSTQQFKEYSSPSDREIFDAGMTDFLAAKELLLEIASTPFSDDVETALEDLSALMEASHEALTALAEETRVMALYSAKGKAEKLTSQLSEKVNGVADAYRAYTESSKVRAADMQQRAHVASQNANLGFEFASTVKDTMMAILDFRANHEASALQRANDAVAILKTTAAEFERQTGQSTSELVQSLDRSFAELVTAREQLDGALADAANLELAFSEYMKRLAAENAAAAGGQQQQATTWLAVMTLASLGFAIVLAAGLARLVGRPIRTLTEITKRVSEGDLTVQVPNDNRKDEIGALTSAMSVFQKNAWERDRMNGEREQMERDRVERQKRVEQLIETFRSTARNALQGMGDNAQELSQAATDLTTTATSASNQSDTAASASHSAAQNVDQVAAAAEQLASSIVDISGRVDAARSVVSDATGHAAATNDKVQGLADAASRIGDVVGLISDIAEQTNLLALNATIEAARAGDAGRGFAVVASEVKTLAEQTAKATGEISSQIQGIQTSTNDAVEAIQKISTTMAEVNAQTSNIADALGEQGTATQSISSSAQGASEGTASTNSAISIVAGAVERTRDVSDRVRQSSQSVSERSRDLEQVVTRFLDDVSAA